MKRPHGFAPGRHGSQESLLHRPQPPAGEAGEAGEAGSARPDPERARAGHDAAAPDLPGDAAASGPRPEPVAESASPSAPRPDRAAPGRSAESDSAHAPSLRAARRARRRHERGEIKRFTRDARRRRRAWLIGIGSVVGVIAATALVALSPLMSLRTISVQGADRVDQSALTHALASQLGTPLALIDYRAVRNEIDRFPLVRSYSTRVVPPGTLVVRIVERTPLGALAVHGGFDLVDQAGVVISHSAGRPAGYPVITLDGAPGSAAAHRSFASSAAVLAALPAETLAQAKDITASSADDVTITLAHGIKVMWGGPAQSDLKAADLSALLKSAPGASLYDVSAPQSPVTG